MGGTRTRQDGAKRTEGVSTASSCTPVTSAGACTPTSIPGYGQRVGEKPRRQRPPTNSSEVHAHRHRRRPRRRDHGRLCILSRASAYMQSEAELAAVLGTRRPITQKLQARPRSPRGEPRGAATAISPQRSAERQHGGCRDHKRLRTRGRARRPTIGARLPLQGGLRPERDDPGDRDAEGPGHLEVRRGPQNRSRASITHVSSHRQRLAPAEAQQRGQR